MFKIVKIVYPYLMLNLLVCFNPRKSEIPKTVLIHGKEHKIYTYNDESFLVMNFDELNVKIFKKSAILSPRAIMEEFHKIKYPNNDNSAEGNRKTTITERKLQNGNIEIKLIDDNLPDDSVKGEKYIMELTKQNNKWVVISLITNWKCQRDRGPNTWGIKLCS